MADSFEFYGDRTEIYTQDDAVILSVMGDNDTRINLTFENSHALEVAYWVILSALGADTDLEFREKLSRLIGVSDNVP